MARSLAASADSALLRFIFYLLFDAIELLEPRDCPLDFATFTLLSFWLTLLRFNELAPCMCPAANQFRICFP